MGMTYQGTETVEVLCSIGLFFKPRNQFVQLLQGTVAPCTAGCDVSHTESQGIVNRGTVDVLLALILDIFLCHIYKVSVVDFLPLSWCEPL